MVKQIPQQNNVTKQMVRNIPQNIGKQDLRQIQQTPSYKLAVEKQKEIEAKINSTSEVLKNKPLDKYAEEYDKIDDSVKQYFINPKDLTQTNEYKTFLIAKDVEKKLSNFEITSKEQIPKEVQPYFQIPNEYFEKVKEYNSAKAYNDAYNAVLKHYNKGMLWAVASYGEGLQKEIAQKMIKEGYSSSKGGKLEQEAYSKRVEAIKSIGGGDYQKGLENYKIAEKIGWDKIGFDEKGQGYSIMPEIVKTDVLPKIDKNSFLPSATKDLNSSSVTYNNGNTKRISNIDLANNNTYNNYDNKEKQEKRFLKLYGKELISLPIELTKSLGKGYIKSDIYLTESEERNRNLIKLPYIRPSIIKRFENPRSTYNLLNSILNGNKLLTKNEKRETLKRALEYNPEIWKDKDVQTLALTVGLGGLGATWEIGGQVAYGGLVGLQGYKTATDFNPENLAGMTYLSLPIASKTGAYAKNKWVSIGTKEIPKETYLGNPTSKNIPEIIEKFETSKTKRGYEGIHTTNKKFTEFKKMEKLRKAYRPEDEVVYMSNKGGGNEAWLEINKNYKREFTTNPFKRNNPNNLSIYCLSFQ